MSSSDEEIKNEKDFDNFENFENSLDEEEFEYTINNNMIMTYCRAFYSFSNIIRPVVS